MKEHETTLAQEHTKELQELFREYMLTIKNVGTLHGYDIEFNLQNGETIDPNDIRITVCWGPK